jgi:hypothetical protein
VARVGRLAAGVEARGGAVRGLGVGWAGHCVMLVVRSGGWGCLACVSVWLVMLAIGCSGGLCRRFGCSGGATARLHSVSIIAVLSGVDVAGGRAAWLLVDGLGWVGLLVVVVCGVCGVWWGWW